ncbi:MAG: thymidine kinase [Anaeroplasma bactoclasticum]|nr:thymidine kinase [Anaeroplasma bactoclasticum]
MDLKSKDGWLEVICGCMFAGKTEELIRRINRIKYAKKEVMVFKPIIDDRYDKKQVVSHSNHRVDSIPIASSKEVLAHIEKLPYAVAFDEAQFFDKGLIDMIERLANSGVRVIVAGLDQDFRGEPFGIMPELMSRAEYVTKLQGICMVCGAPATRTQRLINGRPASYDDPTILVSASEKYESRCRHCHQVPCQEK